MVPGNPMRYDVGAFAPAASLDFSKLQPQHQAQDRRHKALPLRFAVETDILATSPQTQKKPMRSEFHCHLDSKIGELERRLQSCRPLPETLEFLGLDAEWVLKDAKALSSRLESDADPLSVCAGGSIRPELHLLMLNLMIQKFNGL